MRALGMRTFLTLLLGGVLAAGGVGSASALSLGQVAEPNMGGCGSCSVFQYRTAPGAPRYAVPAGATGLWTITSWSAQGGGSQAGRARLRVYRPTATAGNYKLIKQSRYQLVPADAHPSFTTNLNVKKGDLLGLETVSGLVSAYSVSANSTAKTVGGGPPLGAIVGPGTPFMLGTLTFEQVNVQATLVPR